MFDLIKLWFLRNYGPYPSSFFLKFIISDIHSSSKFVLKSFRNIFRKNFPFSFSFWLRKKGNFFKHKFSFKSAFFILLESQASFIILILISKDFSSYVKLLWGDTYFDWCVPIFLHNYCFVVINEFIVFFLNLKLLKIVINILEFLLESSFLLLPSHSLVSVEILPNQIIVVLVKFGLLFLDSPLLLLLFVLLTFHFIIFHLVYYKAILLIVIKVLSVFFVRVEHCLLCFLLHQSNLI